MLMAAAERLLRHGCVNYGNLKKAVAYLEDQGTTAGVAAYPVQKPACPVTSDWSRDPLTITTRSWR